MRPGPILHSVVAAAIGIAFAATLVGLDRLGTSARRFGEPTPVAERPLNVRVVDTSAELFGLWQDAGVHGRLLVHLSRYFHFVPIAGNDAADGLDRFPIRTFDLPRWYESQLDATNVLWVALQAGLVRGVYHVLPPAELDARLAALDPLPPGVRILARSIRTFDGGSPRVAADRLPELDEPVLFAVDASYLADRPPAAVLLQLQSSHLRSDLVVLGRAEDNPDVDPEARQRLDELAVELTARSR